MSETRLTFVATEGVLTFDGEVVEAFGFGADMTRRLHTAMVNSVETGQGGRFTDPSLTIKAHGVGYHVFATFTQEEAASPELAQLVDAVRSASPNLESA